MEYQADYLIAGAGAAGLSLALRLADSGKLKDKKIILIDREDKRENDRTWCYWERGKGYFDSILHHSWTWLRMEGDGDSLQREISPYRYKMLRAADFYAYAIARLEHEGRLSIIRAEVQRIESMPEETRVHTDQGIYRGQWCFSSIRDYGLDRERNHYLDQYFKGWFIRTQAASFRQEEAHFMDFRTRQEGETRFFYVLPKDPFHALVEIALFTRQPLTEEQCDERLETYLRDYWGLDPGAYTKEQEETGVIPMTDAPFRRRVHRTIYVGMAGGDTRASTGFTFLNIQRRVEGIVQALERGTDPGRVRESGRFRFYDRVLLRVLEERRYPGDRLFLRLFRRNPMQRVLAFLQGDSHPWEEVRLMLTVPIGVFFHSALRMVFGRTIDR